MKNILSLFLFLIVFIHVNAQIPQAFKYQAIARDNTGNVLVNQNVSFKVSILFGNVNGHPVYTETHNLTTSSTGLIVLEINGGNIVFGSFEEINWGSSIYFLQIMMDENGGTNYQLLGTSQLLSVPYSMNSRSLTLTSPGGINYDVTIDDEGNLISHPIFICGELLYDSIDGQSYETIKIGNQCWMAENLNVGIRLDGSEEQSDNDTIEKYCYSDLESNCDTYGGLYQWNEMMKYSLVQGEQGICPPGWHLSTDEDWKLLEGTVDSLYSYPDPQWDVTGVRGYDAGLVLKSLSEWVSGGNGTNLWGFNTLPGGGRATSGLYASLGFYGFFWTSNSSSSVEARRRQLSYNFDGVNRNVLNKNFGFSVRCVKDSDVPNQPPQIPYNSSPENGAINQPVDILLNWSCSDPEGDPLMYDVYLGTELDPPLLETGLTLPNYNPDILVHETTFYWKVVAHDNNGNITGGPVWSFTTSPNQPPNQPLDPSPGNGSVDQSVNSILSWTCTDPDNEPLIYNIYFGNEVDPQLLNVGITDIFYVPGLLIHDTTYYWKITAIDPAGDSTISNVWSFTTSPNQPPNQPLDPSPENGGVDQSVNSILSWTCTDPDNEPLNYNIYFSNEVDPLLINVGITDTFYVPGLLIHDTTYYWKVTAFDPAGDSAVSNVWNFTTEIEPISK